MINNNNRPRVQRKRNKYIPPKETISLLDALKKKPVFKRCCVCKVIGGVAYLVDKYVKLPNSGRPAMYSDGYCDVCASNMKREVIKCL